MSWSNELVNWQIPPAQEATTATVRHQELKATPRLYAVQCQNATPYTQWWHAKCHVLRHCLQVLHGCPHFILSTGFYRIIILISHMRNLRYGRLSNLSSHSSVSGNLKPAFWTGSLPGSTGYGAHQRGTQMVKMFGKKFKTVYFFHKTPRRSHVTWIKLSAIFSWTTCLPNTFLIPRAAPLESPT